MTVTVPHHVLYEMTRPSAGHEDDFHRWYDDVHIPEMLAIPGFMAARRFTAVPSVYREIPELPYLALYEIESESLEKTMELFREAERGFSQSSALHTDVSTLAFTQFAQIVTGQTGYETAAPHIMLVQIRALPGREDEFNDWYESKLLRRVLTIPGYAAVRRFTPAPNHRGTRASHTYLSVYEIRSDDHEGTMNVLRGLAKGIHDGRSAAAGPDDIHRSYKLLRSWNESFLKWPETRS